MSDSYVSLHNHCEYSFLDGFGHPHQFVKRAKELNQTALAITDHGNVSAHKRWFDECTKAGIKPILGCEAYVCDDATKKEGRRLWHITLLARNAEGYRNLLKIVTLSWEESHFYYKPRTDWETLRQFRKGIVATSGCPGGRVGKGVLHDHWSTAEVVKEMQRQGSLFEDDGYFVELSPWQYEEGKQVANVVYGAAVKEGLPIVITMDSHYPEEKDAYTQDVMLCIQNNAKFDDPNRMKFSQQDFCLHSGETMAKKWTKIHGKKLPFRDEMILNTKRIADSVKLQFPQAVPLVFDCGGRNPKDFFRSLCNEGLKRRKLTGKPAYKKRMEYEFDLIISKNFIDYFLIVQDLIVWAKNNGILVGAARGSSCGSLICYLLRITEVDPLTHGLMFERFIDVSRTDLPDIDIDFESERRDEVKNYLYQKYGNDRVANLATFGTFKGRLCLQDIGRVFSNKIPYEAVEECKRLIIQRSSADSRYGFTVEDTFTNFEQAAGHLKKYPELGLAKELEGQIRHLGVHAAGVVISNEPIGNFAAVYKTKDGGRVISMDYHDATSVGLLKIDILGLTALTAMKRTLKLIKERHGEEIDINSVPLEDEGVYDNFCAQHLHGIFQFEGESTRQVCRQVQPRKFIDVVAINALSRPGPLHSGGTTSFIERRFGREPIKRLHPAFDKVNESTYGITVYQEQVMRIVRDVGGFDWSGIATVRKMMSKKYGDEAFAAMKEKFVEGASKKDIPVDVAVEIWATIVTHGAWSFNQCATGDTVLETGVTNMFTTRKMTLKELFDNCGYTTSKWELQPASYRKASVLGMDVDGRIRPSRIKNVFYKGIQQVFEVRTESGKKIRCTPNHRLLSKTGFKEIRELAVGDFIAVNGGIEEKSYPGTKTGKAWRKGRKGGCHDFLDYRTKEVKTFRASHFGLNCEHCDKPHQRMEAHHVTRNPPNSILEWLCPGCHKKAEYAQGRTKVWQKGFAVVWDKITYICRKDREKVYDIEMEDDCRPTYIANGIVSHNSHSVAYSIMAYQLMWLKVHYPVEFYCSVIGCEPDETKQRRLFKEYTNAGHNKLLPVDINKSELLVSCDNDGLRLGFDAVGGLTEKIKEKIVSNRPFKSFVDFTTRCKIPEVQSEKLLKIGAFRNLSFKSLSAQQDLFGATESQRIDFDYKTPTDKDLRTWCPLAAEDKDKEWSGWVKNNIRGNLITIRDLDGIDSQRDVMIMGHTDPRKGFNMKNKMEEFASKGKVWAAKEGEEDLTREEYNFLNFDMEDETDSVIVRVSYKLYPKFKELLWDVKPDEMVGVRGRVTGSIRMVFSFNVVNLTRLKAKIENNEELTKTERLFVSGEKPFRNQR